MQLCPAGTGSAMQLPDMDCVLVCLKHLLMSLDPLTHFRNRLIFQMVKPDLDTEF